MLLFARDVNLVLALWTGVRQVGAAIWTGGFSVAGYLFGAGRVKTSVASFACDERQPPHTLEHTSDGCSARVGVMRQAGCRSSRRTSHSSFSPSSSFLSFR